MDWSEPAAADNEATRLRRRVMLYVLWTRLAIVAPSAIGVLLYGFAPE